MSVGAEGFIYNMQTYLLLSIYLVIFKSCSAGKGNGRIDLKINEVIACEEKGTNEIDFTGLKIIRMEKNRQGLEGKYTIKVPFDDVLVAKIDIAQFSNRVWKEHFFEVEIEHVCNKTATYFPVYYEMLTKPNGIEGCPVPAGEYNSKALELGKEQFGLPGFLPYGKYKTEVKLYKENTKVGCIVVIADIADNRKKKG